MPEEFDRKPPNSSRRINQGKSAPIPPLRFGSVPLQNPVKVKVVISEQPPPPPVQMPLRPVQVLVSAEPPIAHKFPQPKPKSKPNPQPKRRKVRVLIAEQADKKFFGKRHLAMTQVRPSGNWKVNLLVTTLLLSAMVLVGGGGWLALDFIFNPDSVAWLAGNRGLPKIAGAPQTLKEINAEATRMGLTVGSPLYISTYPGVKKGTLGTADVLLPLSARSDPQKMTELRIYRQTQQTQKTVFELKDRIAIIGPDEAEAIAPLSQSTELIHGSNRPLPLKELDFVEGKAPAAGVWLQLNGEWEKSGSQVTYGRIIHYDPVRARFRTLLTWSSPAGLIPHWQQVTGDSETELFLDQTVGLEPHFQVYQVKIPKGGGMQLEAIAFTKPALSNRTYDNALLLAQNGLWSAALDLFTLVKQNGDWNDNAQAQLDIAKLHAQATKAQAERTWASPTQQITALLMDGRWTKALDQLKAARDNGYDITSLLNANADQLLRRIEAAVSVAPEADAWRWGALIVAIQGSNGEAIDWLQKHQAPASTHSVLALLNSVDNATIQTIGEEALPKPSISPAKPEPAVSPEPEYYNPDLIDPGTEPLDNTPESFEPESFEPERFQSEPLDPELAPESSPEADAQPEPELEPPHPKDDVPAPKR